MICKVTLEFFSVIPLERKYDAESRMLTHKIAEFQNKILILSKTTAEEHVVVETNVRAMLNKDMSEHIGQHNNLFCPGTSFRYVTYNFSLQGNFQYSSQNR